MEQPGSCCRAQSKLLKRTVPGPAPSSGPAVSSDLASSPAPAVESSPSPYLGTGVVACWMETKAQAPCPPDQYQEGANCYIPLTPPPNAPVQPSGEQPRSSQGEPTGAQPRPVEEMKEEH